jgi:hypothetical protein
VAVGARWIEWGEDCYHCAPTVFLQNIQSGATKPDPVTPGGYVLDDLDSVSGTKALCAPLRYPAFGPADQNQSGTVELGQIAFYGRFALVWGSAGHALERCGSRLRVRLPATDIQASDHAVVWQANPTTGVHGLFLPSLRPFIIPLPPTLMTRPFYPALAALTDHTLYATGVNGEIWAATLPPR